MMLHDRTYSRHTSVICCCLAEAVTAIDMRMTRIRCVMCSVYSVRHKSSSIQPAAITDRQHAISSRRERQLSRERRAMGRLYDTPAYV